jgi:hypothetical protein
MKGGRMLFRPLLYYLLTKMNISLAFPSHLPRISLASPSHLPRISPILREANAKQKSIILVVQCSIDYACRFF